MSELISGEEALKEITSGRVQYMHPSELEGNWTTITDHFWAQYSLDMFLDKNTKFKFRMKPNTIAINGIEVPAPFESKRGEIPWHTEEEIKQVVSTLRSIFKGDVK